MYSPFAWRRTRAHIRQPRSHRCRVCPSVHPRRAPMQRHALTIALLCTLATACSSTSTTAERSEADDTALIAPAPPPEAEMADEGVSLDQVLVTGTRVAAKAMRQMAPASVAPAAPMIVPGGYWQPNNTEKYATREDNPVQRTSEQPVSTFSVDVDTGSYANVRRMLRDGVRPPADAVRAEEFINYFDYGHPAPASRKTPFRVTTELAPAPWNSQRQLLLIGIKEIGRASCRREWRSEGSGGDEKRRAEYE